MSPSKLADLIDANWTEYRTLLVEYTDLKSGKYYATCQEDYDYQCQRLKTIGLRLDQLRLETPQHEYNLKHGLHRNQY